MFVSFKSIEDGQEITLSHNGTLKTVPGTGDIITDEATGGYTYLVESVIHYNVFNSPGEHSVIVHLKKM